MVRWAGSSVGTYHKQLLWHDGDDAASEETVIVEQVVMSGWERRCQETGASNAPARPSLMHSNLSSPDEVLQVSRCPHPCATLHSPGRQYNPVLFTVFQKMQIQIFIFCNMSVHVKVQLPRFCDRVASLVSV